MTDQLIPPGLIQIPGTNYWGIERDALLTAASIQHRTIKLDEHLLQIPAIAERLRPGALCLDIGAFIGGVTRMMLDRGCQVWAFEPQPDAFTCLKHNCPEAVYLQSVVGDGDLSMVVDPVEPVDRNYGSRMARVVDYGRRSLAIDQMVFGQRVGFVKIDVEGSEPLTLKGMQRLLEQDQPVLLVEINRPSLKDHCFEVSDVTDFLQDYWLTPVQPERENTDLPWDYICVPR